MPEDDEPLEEAERIEEDSAADAPVYTELHPVFFGSYGEAIALQASLAAAGYDTFLLEVEEAPQVQPEDEATAELAILGRRIRWASVVGVLAPLGLYWGIQYGRKLASAKRLPAGHAWTIPALLLCCAYILALGAWIFLGWFEVQ